MRKDYQVLFWIAALVLLVAGIALLHEILLPFVAGMTIAYFLNPLADRLTRHGMRRIGASALLVTAGGLVFAGVLVLLMPLVLNQAQQLIVALPNLVESGRAAIETFARERLGSHFPAVEAGLNRAASAAADNWGTIAGGVAKSLLDRGMAVFNFLSLMLVTPLVVFYLLVDWHPMLAKIDGWLPRDSAPTIRRLAAEINDAVSAFIRGQGTVCLALGTYYAGTLSLTGLSYGLLVGLATGILSFVPFAGWALGLITSLVLAVLQFGGQPSLLALVVAIFVGGQALDAAVLSPVFVGKKIGLHPVWLIFALFVFSYLFGFVGMLVAVPVAAALGVLVRYALTIYLGSALYHGQPAEEPAQPAGAILPKEPAAS